MTGGISRSRQPAAQRGSVTLIGLGLLVMIMVVGGISIDLWRVFGARGALAEMAEAAAAAGANGIDTARFRATGEVMLDAPLADALAHQSLREQSDRSFVGRASISVQETRVVVELEGEVPFTLLRLVAPGRGFTIRVQAEAAPRSG